VRLLKQKNDTFLGLQEQSFFKSVIITRKEYEGKIKSKFMLDVTRAYNNAKEIIYKNSSKFVIMSDIHRGDNRKHDNFAQNKDLYMAVLKRYYKDDFTYIELGDGEELWENRSMDLIVETYLDIYLLQKKFYKKGRLHIIYGNHDMEKKSQKFVEDHLYQYYDKKKQKHKDLFKGIKTYEAIVLKTKHHGGEIFLLHGHQVDFLNNRLWRLARFMVRLLWKPLEHIGVKDPTRTAQIYEKKKAVEKRLTEWIIENKVIMITGHTHKPMFSDFDTPAYFNDGSCVSDDAITAIEIQNDEIALIKWYYKINEDGDKIVTKETMAGPENINKYFEHQANLE